MKFSELFRKRKNGSSAAGVNKILYKDGKKIHLKSEAPHREFPNNHVSHEPGHNGPIAKELRGHGFKLDKEFHSADKSSNTVYWKHPDGHVAKTSYGGRESKTPGEEHEAFWIQKKPGRRFMNTVYAKGHHNVSAAFHGKEIDRSVEKKQKLSDLATYHG